MRYDAERREASPLGRGKCPCCAANLIAKCGDIVSWHWAHATGADCDHWYEPISEWHLSWQSTVPPECREVVIGPHRADIVHDGYIIELQHSTLPPAEIREREVFYGSRAPNGLLWIWDARDFTERVELRKYDPSSGWLSFRWKHPRKSTFACGARQWWDLGNGWILKEVQASEGSYVAGMGRGYLRKLDSDEWPKSTYQKVKRTAPFGNPGFIYFHREAETLADLCSA